MIHGTSGRLHDFRPLEQFLAPSYELWLFDRRGRGWSGDTEPYELEDAVAVVAAAGGMPTSSGTPSVG